MVNVSVEARFAHANINIATDGVQWYVTTDQGDSIEGGSAIGVGASLRGAVPTSVVTRDVIDVVAER